MLAQLIDDGLCLHRPVDGVEKYILTTAGRDKGEEALAAELDETGTRPVVEAAYQQFRQLNPAMLELCTDWQVKPPPHQPPAEPDPPAADPAASPSAPATDPPGRTLNDHTDPTYDTLVLTRLAELSFRIAGVLSPLSDALERYSHYRRQFDKALERIADGDLKYFTKPIIPSFHTIWFELHEDLLATLNLTRSQETE